VWELLKRFDISGIKAGYNALPFLDISGIVFNLPHINRSIFWERHPSIHSIFQEFKGNSDKMMPNCSIF
jgi:hypothetical protein